MMPARAPRCLGSAAILITVSALARISRLWISRLFWDAMSAICLGKVKTKWKYRTGSSSASRAASHAFAAVDWHLGQ